MKKEEIYSKLTGELLHIVLRDIVSHNTEERDNIVDNNQFLQLAVLKMGKDTTFKAHKHIYKKQDILAIAQESWVVLNGKVKVFFYDLNDQLIEQKILDKYDVSVTLKGGHNYYILEDNTFVLEYKTGPYQGQKLDKEFL